ncbi:MAG: tetratricopeptide repeat protein, partial [Acidobacteria bacterium]|nr:tetratricopeptide repeat protein [Acidobacteriota bacterium]
MPFVNESGNADTEYLSDGMTETLIGRLSQLPKLSVKARTSVFRYKGKDASPRTVGNDLSVQAVLLGRVIQRGDLLTLGLELVDARTENVIWSEQYNRRQTDLVSLQSEIARDVSNKLRVRLSGADEQKLAKNYTANAEAYQLYLKGRYHLLKTTRSEFQKAISYFQQAIEIDPSYALAYTGLADAYRSLTLAGEMNPTEVFPKAKAAAQKAIEIDDTLADAHAVLGFIIFWYDWDWNAAENQYQRALALDPNNADAHLFYANLLSSTGRRAEGLAEAKRARELDPLNLRTNALE